MAYSCQRGTLNLRQYLALFNSDSLHHWSPSLLVYDQLNNRPVQRSSREDLSRKKRGEEEEGWEGRHYEEDNFSVLLTITDDLADQATAKAHQRLAGPAVAVGFFALLYLQH
jgi:hypothetical protein